MSGLEASSRRLWKSTDQELHLYLSHENGSDINCYRLTLALEAPLEKNHMEQTLKHLYRKCPNLRVCLELDENGQLWTCQMKEEKILLEFCDGDFEEKYFEEVKKKHQLYTGPLWRVTVMSFEPKPDEMTALGSFCHHYQVLISFQHSITDGHTSMRLCGILVSLLDDVMNNRNIDDDKQLGEFLDGTLNEKVTAEVRKTLENDKAKYKLIKEKLSNEENSTLPIFVKSKSVNKGRTSNLEVNLSEILTRNFFKSVKSNGVSVHSTFCTAINAAIVQTLRYEEYELNLDETTINIRTFHDINRRRYYGIDCENLFGAHVALHRKDVLLHGGLRRNFWESSHEFHSQFSKELEEKECYMYSIVQSDTTPSPKTLEQFRAFFSKSPFYYGVSNMGNVTRFFKKADGSDYDSVRAVHLRRTTSMPQSIYISKFCIHTLNGRLFISFDFVTSYIDPSFAKNLLGNIVKIIEEVSSE